LSEATTTKGRGSYVSPWVPALKEFEKNVNGPFTEPANSYDDPLLDYDIMDGSWTYNKKTRDKLEKRANKIKNSGTKPEVPGNPTLANEITIKKNEKIGIVLKRPEKAIIDRV
jgi:hypothetical protein